MQGSAKTIAASALCGLVVGLLLGFIPEHLQSSDLKHQLSSSSQSASDVQHQLGDEQTRFVLSNFTVRSAAIYMEAENNNYSDASAAASSFFTDLRKFTDQSSDGQRKQYLEQVLSIRDATISGLAKADPGVKIQIRQMFIKMRNVSDQAAK